MGTYAANILPDTTGRDLGSDPQRWDAFIQTLDVSGSVVGDIVLKYLNGIRFADQFSGATPGAQIDAALADSGCKIVIAPSTLAAGAPTSIGTGQYVIDFRSGFKIFSNASVSTAAVSIADSGAITLGTALADTNLAQITTASKVSTSAITGTLPVANGGTGVTTSTGTGSVVRGTSPTITTANFSAPTSDSLLLTGTTVTAAAGQVSFSATSVTTVGASSTGATVPSRPVGYLVTNVGGTSYNIPFFSQT